MWMPAECKTSSLEIVSELGDAAFIFEEKMDGLRAVCEVLPGGNMVTGRSGTEISKPHAAGLRAAKFGGNLQGYAFDGELMPDGHYWIFDVLAVNGRDVRNERQGVRKALLDGIAGDMPEGVAVLPWYRTLAEVGEFTEGVVVKDTARKYGHGWFKAKRMDTDDVTVLALDRETGVADVGCGKVTGVPASVRVGDCIEVVLFNRTAAGKLRSGRYLRLRDDKSTSNHDDERSGLRSCVAAGR